MNATEVLELQLEKPKLEALSDGYTISFQDTEDYRIDVVPPEEVQDE